MFHKFNSERDLAILEGDSDRVKSCEKKLKKIGGIAEYQRASQLSTSFHSTSKWVLGHLANNGWLFGIKAGDSSSSHPKRERGKRTTPRRTTKILEVGAINTELLDAAGVVTPSLLEGGESKRNDHSPPMSPLSHTSKKYNIHVRAIDIHSMEERIEEADFLQLRPPTDPANRYDVIVCSMVLNCVTTPSDRGKMLALLYHQLRPGGLCFFTLPKYCLTKSAFLTPNLFRQMLGSSGVGFEVKSTKESPRIAFFILERPGLEELKSRKLPTAFTTQKIINKGKKFPNQFSVVLEAKHVFGSG